MISNLNFLKMKKKILFTFLLSGLFSGLLFAQGLAGPDLGDENGGVKQQWYWHECELGSQNGTREECGIVSSDRKCGKPQKRRPSGTCT